MPHIIYVSSLCCSPAIQMSEDILKMNLGPQLGELFVLAFMQARVRAEPLAPAPRTAPVAAVAAAKGD